MKEAVLGSVDGLKGRGEASRVIEISGLENLAEDLFANSKQKD